MCGTLSLDPKRRADIVDDHLKDAHSGRCTGLALIGPVTFHPDEWAAPVLHRHAVDGTDVDPTVRTPTAEPKQTHLFSAATQIGFVMKGRLSSNLNVYDLERQHLES